MKSTAKAIALAGFALLMSPPASAAPDTRTETIEYHDDTALWVVGQVKRITEISTGAVMSETSYSSTHALPEWHESFGQLQHLLSYDTSSGIATGQRGTVRTVTDGNGNITTVTGWKRGIPQSIRHADDSTQSAAVNADGTLGSVTDENGYTTYYTYDARGRLTRVSHSSADWNDTTQSFTRAGSIEYGVPAGHWRQTVSTGNGRTIRYFDALWRPLLVREYDAGAVAATERFTRFRYDHEGRTTFASYPSADANTVSGTWTEYDGIGRPTSVSQDSELGLLISTTSYLNDAAGDYVAVTNPRQQVTRTWHHALDVPSTSSPVAIKQPEGVATTIARDVFGNPEAVTRGDASATLTRRYVYDTKYRLCKTIEPETNATIIEYDAAGNVAWSASGQPYLSTTSCEQTSVPLTQRVVRQYDSRNRVRLVTYPDNRGNLDYTYTPDGLVESVTAVAGANVVTTTYAYNRLRLLSQETLNWNNIQWGIGYGYTANGHLASVHYPTGLAVGYAPNALGQPTRAGNFATGVSYWPNGAIKQFTYGNGIVHTLSQNARGLPVRSRDAYGSTAVHDDSYDYDFNGNVAAISDGLAGNVGDRTMSYDGLDRLTQVISPMFGGDNRAVFGYDAIDNLLYARVGSQQQVTYHYDASNRLTNVHNAAGATVIGLGYDARGNVINKNGKAFDFDYGNRLRAISGTASYVYDGLGRRVRDVTGGSKYSLYSKAGQLLYVNDHRRALETDYVYLGGSLVAMREQSHGSSAVTVKYQHTDALGSPVVVTDGTAQVLERDRYGPYGTQIGGAANDGPGYTGHVMDAASGLTYMQQRYYDPSLGRFLSVDPVTANGNTGANFNRYWYANNNPYRFFDPDGRLSYEAELRGKKLPVNIDDRLPIKQQEQLKTKVDAGLAKLNDAKLSKQESAVINNVKSLSVSGEASRSFIQEDTGALTLTDDFVDGSSSTWLGSSVAHDGMHGELFDAGGISLSRGLDAEVTSMKFQLRVGEKIGMPGHEKSYLNNLMANPELLKSYINSSP